MSVKQPKVFDGTSRGALSGTVDRHNGLMIDVSRIKASTTADELRPLLIKSIVEYKKEKFRSVWLKLTVDKSHLAAVAVQDAGMKLHHAKDDYIMLTIWLPTDEENKIPSFSTHYVGVGGFVLNKDHTKILAIQE